MRVGCPPSPALTTFNGSIADLPALPPTHGPLLGPTPSEQSQLVPLQNNGTALQIQATGRAQSTPLLHEVDLAHGTCAPRAVLAFCIGPHHWLKLSSAPASIALPWTESRPQVHAGSPTTLSEAIGPPPKESSRPPTSAHRYVYVEPQYDYALFPSMDRGVTCEFIRRHPEFIVQDSWCTRREILIKHAGAITVVLIGSFIALYYLIIRHGYHKSRGIVIDITSTRQGTPRRDVDHPSSPEHEPHAGTSGSGSVGGALEALDSDASHRLMSHPTEIPSRNGGLPVEQGVRFKHRDLDDLSSGRRSHTTRNSEESGPLANSAAGSIHSSAEVHSTEEDLMEDSESVAGSSSQGVGSASWTRYMTRYRIARTWTVSSTPDSIISSDSELALSTTESLDSIISADQPQDPPPRYPISSSNA